MSTEKEYLNPIVSRRQSPYFWFEYTLAGNNGLRIYSLDNLTVPGVWSIAGGRLVLTTDATVANRQSTIAQNISGYDLIAHHSQNVAASSANGFGLIREHGFSNAAPQDSDYCTLTRESFTLRDKNDYIGISVLNGVAGDVLLIKLLFRWLNWDLGMMLPRVQKDSK